MAECSNVRSDSLILDNRTPRIVIQKSGAGRASRLDTPINYIISVLDGNETAIFHLVFTHINRKTINHRLWIFNLTLRRLMSYIYMEHPFLMFLDHTQRRITVGRTPLDEWSARHGDLYLTTHNTHNRHTSMPPVGFKPTISAGERPQTYALDRTAIGTGNILCVCVCVCVCVYIYIYIYIYIYTYIHGVSGGIVNILGGGSMDYSE